MKKNETKNERFIRVVTPRVNKAIKEIHRVALCAGYAYENTDEQAAAIVGALEKALDDLKVAYFKPNTSSPFK